MKKRISILLAELIIVATSGTVVFAETQSISSNSKAEVDVVANLTSNYSVIVPKNLEISATSKTVAYQAQVNGDISGTEMVTVEPESTFLLSSMGKSDVTATVTQDKTKFLVGDMNTTTNGIVTAQGLTAGNWSGKFSFNIKLGEKPLTAGLYTKDGALLCPWTESGLNIETNYNVTTGESSTSSGHYVLNTIYPTATKVVIPEGTTRIGNYAFYDCVNIEEVIIPSSVVSIGTYAFSGCTDLFCVKVPESVTSVGNEAFQNVSLVLYTGSIDTNSWGAGKVSDDRGEYIDFVLTEATFDKMGIEKAATLVIPETFEYKNKKFKVVKIKGGVNNFKSSNVIVVPKTVTEIIESAFSQLNGIKLYLPTSIQLFKYSALGCTNSTIYYAGSESEYNAIEQLYGGDGLDSTNTKVYNTSYSE